MQNKITDYKLKCGNVFYRTINRDTLFYTQVELYHEHNAYHVRRFKHVINSTSCDRISWDVFNTLKEALKCFNS